MGILQPEGQSFIQILKNRTVIFFQISPKYSNYRCQNFTDFFIRPCVYSILKLCSHGASALTLALMPLDQFRTHLNFEANVDADAWCE